jgi:hypothetical protein
VWGEQAAARYLATLSSSSTAVDMDPAAGQVPDVRAGAVGEADQVAGQHPAGPGSPAQAARTPKITRPD